MRKSMGVLYLSWKSMKYNKRKTILLILTTALAVCLMTVVMLYLYSSRQRNIEIAASEAGQYHAEYRNLSKWQSGQLAKEESVRKLIDVSAKEESKDIRILLRSDVNCKNVLEEIEHRLGIQRRQIFWNIIYLDAANISITSILQMACILAGLLLSAVIVVCNIFQIYIMYDVRLYGAMRAIGFEDNQLKRFLRFEGFITGCAGSFIGILAGLFFSDIFIPIFGKTETAGKSLEMTASAWIMTAVFFSGILIVLLGMQRPVASVMKLSVIETMNYQAVSKADRKGKRSKTPGQISLWDLSKINFIRNRTKNVWVILSLSVTGAMFLIAASIIDSMDMKNMLYMIMRGDYNLEVSEEEARNRHSSVCLEQDLIQGIREQKGITDIHTIMYDRLMWNRADAKNHIQITDEFQELGIGYENINSVLYGYDDAFLNACLRQSGNEDLTEADMRENNYVIVVENGISDFKINDTVRLKEDENDNEETEFTIVGIIKNNITYRGYSGAGNDFILHQNRLEALHLDSRIKRLSITVKPSSKDSVKEYLESLAAQNAILKLESRDELLPEYSGQKKALETGSYSLIMLLFGISIMNLINTNLSNILSRRQEIGMLEAIGLTGSQENRMFQTEGLMVIGISCLITILTGIPLGYAGFTLFRQSAGYAIYKVPIPEMIVLSISYLFVQIIVIRCTIGWLGRQSIMDKIRQEDL